MKWNGSWTWNHLIWTRKLFTVHLQRNIDKWELLLHNLSVKIMYLFAMIIYPCFWMHYITFELENIWQTNIKLYISLYYCQSVIRSIFLFGSDHWPACCINDQSSSWFHIQVAMEHFMSTLQFFTKKKRNSWATSQSAPRMASNLHFGSVLNFNKVLSILYGTFKKLDTDIYRPQFNYVNH